MTCTNNSRAFSLLAVLLASTFPMMMGAGVFKRIQASSNSEQSVEQMQARLSEQVSIQSARRGNPWINLADGRDLITSFIGPSELVRAMEQNNARPLALASADFDEDGVPDLAASYASDSGGIITLHRGNVDSIYPNSPDAKRRRAQGRFTEAPFLSPAQVFAVSEAADFIGAGDFDGDSHFDLVTAARGGAPLRLLSGDGRGGLSESKVVDAEQATTAPHSLF